MSDYRLSDLLDLTIIQKMADAHYRAAGMPIGIIDAIDGSILVGAGWQDICTKFHRVHPVALQRCQESDDYIKGRLINGETCQYKCKNGLWDIGIPIMVAGHHLATMFLGQFFFEGEVPDRNFFIQQANEFGFNVGAYLTALDAVPVFNREKVEYILEYDKALVNFIADLAEQSLLKAKADKEIKRQAEFLQLLIDAMPYPVFYKDQHGRYIGCNRAFELFYGMSREQIAGKTVYEIAPKELADVYQRSDDELFVHPGAQMYDGCVRSSDGVLHDVTFHKASFKGPDGTIAGIVGALVDITERKHAEEEKQRLQDQLSSVQKMESVGRLAGGVAHDFNNMLSIIIGYSELILRKLGQEDPFRKELESIHAAAERSRDITRQLLAFARKEIITPKVLDLNTSVEKTLAILRRLIGEDIELVWRPGNELWPVLIDPSQLDQLLANLCINARDAISGVGRIIIDTGNVTFDESYCSMHVGFKPGDFVSLSISDNGSGIDSAIIDKIFEPFFTTKNLGMGTGLGLATVYGIVKQNNGYINVSSAPNAGSTFIIYFPRHDGDVGHEGRLPAEGILKGHGETVLVVEDEISILELVKNILSDFNYNVMTAQAPSEALQLASAYKGEMALLITDVVMPEMNGRELAERIKSLFPNIKCLFMSGYTANVIAHRGVLDKGFLFIQKPFAPSDFVNKVSSVLNEGSGS